MAHFEKRYQNLLKTYQKVCQNKEIWEISKLELLQLYHLSEELIREKVDKRYKFYHNVV